MAAKKAKKPEVKQTEVITAYKGFDSNMQCRGFQYEIGKTYTHEGPVEACSSGFHACENPLDVWSYYTLDGKNKFCSVELSGSLSRHEEDSKIAAATISIKAEIGLPTIIADAVKFVMSLVNASNETTATTGNWANAATTGYRANAATTGNWANAATTGEHAVSAALGIEGKAKAGIGGAIVLCYRNNNGGLIHIRASKVGENGIKPDVFYELDENGYFVEVSDAQ